VSLALTGCGSGGTPVAPATPPSQPGLMTRGPYLQHADDGVVVAWHTATPGAGDKREATLQGLVPGVRYSYRVYSPLGPLVSTSGEVEFPFRAPETGVLRFAAFGDSGAGTADQRAVALALGAESLLPDFVMLVGDVVYPPYDATS